MLFRCSVALLCCFIAHLSLSQEVTPVNRPEEKEAGNKARVIKRLEDCELPEEMLYRIMEMTPEKMKNLQEEYQSITREEGDEFVVTIKLRFVEDFIYGYIRKAPLTNTANIQNSTTTILIPVEFCCTPAKSDHQKHCVRINEIRLFDSTEKCVKWALKEKQAQDSAYFAKIDAGKKKKKPKLELDSTTLASLKGLSKKERKKRIAFLEQQLEKGSDSTAANSDSSTAIKENEAVQVLKPKSKKELRREEKERMNKLKSERRQANKPEDTDDSGTKNE